MASLEALRCFTWAPDYTKANLITKPQLASSRFKAEATPTFGPKFEIGYEASV
jgi:hypothetical protein